MSTPKQDALARLTQAVLLYEVARSAALTLRSSAGLDGDMKAIPLRDCMAAGVTETELAEALDKAKLDPRVKRMAAACVTAIAGIVEKGGK